MDVGRLTPDCKFKLFAALWVSKFDFWIVLNGTTKIPLPRMDYSHGQCKLAQGVQMECVITSAWSIHGVCHVSRDNLGPLGEGGASTVTRQ